MNVYQTKNIRACVVVGVLVSAAIFLMLIWPGTDKTQDNSIRKTKPMDLSTFLPDDKLIKNLTKFNLFYNKSRGATIFTDKDGAVRIPPAQIVDKLEFRDLEELYHRYLESIQTVCHSQLHFGSHEDGGYDLCLDKTVVPTQPCLVYSFGVRDDFSFDEEVSRVFGCEIHSFDPANGMKDHAHSPTVYFHAMGLGDSDGYRGNWKMRTAASIKHELGHTEKHIEIMKLDIEAGEWTALPEMLKSGTLKGVKQLIMEFHSWVDLPPWNIDHRNRKDYRQHLNVLRDLYDEGFRIFFFKRFPAKCCFFDDEFGVKRKHIEIMKLDIEAGEWTALPEMLKSGTLKGVKQLIMEFHSWVDLPPWNIDHRNRKDYRQHLNVLRDTCIYDEGFRIFFFERFPAKCCFFDDEFGVKRKHIEIMKLDIEAGEWTALPEMLKSGTLKGVKQLIMEFHSWVDLPPWNIDHRNRKDYRQHLNVLRDLYDEGFRIFFFKRFPAKCCFFDDEFGVKRKHIEIMKLDIEAGEWTALPEMLKSGTLKGVKQLIMEFHSWVDLPPWNIDHRNWKDYRQHLNVLRDLYDEGFRIFFFKRFPAKCCFFDDEFGVKRVGCHEIHLMRINSK